MCSLICYMIFLRMKLAYLSVQFNSYCNSLLQCWNNKVVFGDTTSDHIKAIDQETSNEIVSYECVLCGYLCSNIIGKVM
jgi:hypothetical protein